MGLQHADLSDLGFHLQIGEARTRVIELLRHLKTHGDALAVVRKSAIWSDDDLPVLALECLVPQSDRFPEHQFFLLFFGWDPSSVLSVREIVAQLRAIGNAGATCEIVARKLRTLRGAKTLLGDGAERMAAAFEMTLELDIISKAAWSLVDSLELPTNWRDLPPESAVIYASDCYTRPASQKSEG